MVIGIELQGGRRMSSITGMGYEGYSKYDVKYKKEKAESKRGDGSGKGREVGVLQEKSMDSRRRLVKLEKNNKTDALDEKQQDNLQLSDRAKELLEELKRKYDNMDFFVANYASEEEAQSIMARGSKDYSVLIDPETLEKMAADDGEKDKYTGIIDQAVSQIDTVKKEAEENGGEIERIGITIHEDGSVDYFAELRETSKKQEKERAEEIEEKRAEKRKERKKEEAKRIKLHASTAEDLIKQIKEVDWTKVEETSKKQQAGENLGTKIDFTV